MIVGFTCNWGAYSALDMAGTRRMDYAANVRLVRVPCLGRLHAGQVLQAFALGAEGVLLLGCPPAECHYESGTRIKALFEEAQSLLRLLGIGQERLALIEVTAGDGETFVKQVAEFMRQVNPASAPQEVAACPKSAG